MDNTESPVTKKSVTVLGEIPEDPRSKLALLVTMGYEETNAMAALFKCSMDFVKAWEFLSKDEEAVKADVPNLVDEQTKADSTAKTETSKDGSAAVSFFAFSVCSAFCPLLSNASHDVFLMTRSRRLA